MKMHLVLEGQLEEPVAVKMVKYCGHVLGDVHGKKGCNYIRNKAHLFLSKAKYGDGVFVLTDFMDSKCSCVPEARRSYLAPEAEPISPSFLMRFAVRELESWLLADRAGLAKYFGISEKKIPTYPELEADPKQTLVNLARGSRKRVILDSIVPGPRHGGVVGPGYVAEMSKFVDQLWNIDNARNRSRSLDRCLLRLSELS